MISDPSPAGVRRQPLKFLDWWSTQLAAAFVQRRAAARPWRTLLFRRGGEYEVYVHSREGPALAGCIGLPAADGDTRALLERLNSSGTARRPIVLRLAPDDVVRSRIRLPAAAQDVIEPVLRNQLERLAPWPEDKALFAYEIAGTDDAAAYVDVDVTVVGRAAVEACMAELSEAGIAPDIIDCGIDARAPSPFNLLPSQMSPTVKRGSHLLAGAAAAALCGIAVGAFGLYDMYGTRYELALLQTRLAEVRAARQIDRHGGSLAQRQRWGNALVDQKLSQPSLAIALEALSRALPDEASLDRLEISGGVLVIAGKAMNAAALIGLLESRHQFTDVQFAAPTTKTERGDGEIFAISARLAPSVELE